MEFDSNKLIVAKEYLNHQKKFNNAKDDLKLGWTIAGVVTLIIPLMVFILSWNPISLLSFVFGLPFAILPMFQKEELKEIKKSIIKDNMTIKEFDSFLKSKELDEYLKKIKEYEEELNSNQKEISDSADLQKENEFVYKPLNNEAYNNISIESKKNKKR